MRVGKMYNNQLVHTPDSLPHSLSNTFLSCLRFQKESSFPANTQTCIPITTTIMRFTAVVNLPVIVLALAVGAAALPGMSSGSPRPDPMVIGLDSESPTDP